MPRHLERALCGCSMQPGSRRSGKPAVTAEAMRPKGPAAPGAPSEAAGGGYLKSHAESWRFGGNSIFGTSFPAWESYQKSRGQSTAPTSLRGDVASPLER